MKRFGTALLAVLAAAGPAEAWASPKTERLHLSCSDGVPIDVTLRGDKAEVTRGGKLYRLNRRPTSFTRKYDSDRATYIQDGNSAVFASEDSAFASDCEIRRP